jgi:hypothetical protein
MIVNYFPLKLKEFLWEKTMQGCNNSFFWEFQTSITKVQNLTFYLHDQIINTVALHVKNKTLGLGDLNLFRGILLLLFL